MALAFASSFHLGTGMKTLCKINAISSSLNAIRTLSVQKKFSCSAAVALDRTQASEFELEKKKHNLLITVQGTQRGLVSTADQRSIIEEALVSWMGHGACSILLLLMFLLFLKLLQGFCSFSKKMRKGQTSLK